MTKLKAILLLNSVTNKANEVNTQMALVTAQPPGQVETTEVESHLPEPGQADARYIFPGALALH